MLVGQILQLEGKTPCLVETLVQEAVEATADGTFQVQDEVVIERLDVAAGEAAVDSVVPDEERAGELEAPLYRVRLRPAPLVLLGVNLDSLKDVELLVDPLVGFLVPPCVLVVERDANPPVESLVDAVVTLPIDRPSKELDELVAAEEDPPVLELLELAELEQPKQDLVVGRCW